MSVGLVGIRRVAEVGNGRGSGPGGERDGWAKCVTAI